MTDRPLKRYLFASDFDQTLTFNDSGYVLSELVGIPTAEFERKAKGMAELNLVQQGAVAKRTVLSTDALAVLAPILEDIAGWERLRIRDFFESYGMLIQEWDRVRTDWLTLRRAGEQWSAAGAS